MIFALRKPFFQPRCTYNYCSYLVQLLDWYSLAVALGTVPGPCYMKMQGRPLMLPPALDPALAFTLGTVVQQGAVSHRVLLQIQGNSDPHWCDPVPVDPLHGGRGMLPGCMPLRRSPESWSRESGDMPSQEEGRSLPVTPNLK